MKKLIAGAVVIIAMLLIVFFSSAEWQNMRKHMHSSLTGLNRKITLYNSNGGVIREWTTQSKVEDRGGTCWFIVNGKAVTVSGAFTVEEQ
jgi:uncharacterized lipoprotein YehR (DUF1307 family)